MSENTRKAVLKYAVTVAVGLLIGWAVLRGQNFSGAETTLAKVTILSNAFTAPGALLMLFGGLVFVANHGTFNGISYILGRVVTVLIPGAALSRKYESYKDYLAQKEEKSKAKSFGFLLIVGGVFLAVGVILTAVYYGMQ